MAKTDHVCSGTWTEWDRQTIEDAKANEGDKYKGAKVISKKICDTCGTVIGERTEYERP